MGSRWDTRGVAWNFNTYLACSIKIPGNGPYFPLLHLKSCAPPPHLVRSTMSTLPNELLALVPPPLLPNSLTHDGVAPPTYLEYIKYIFQVGR